MTHGLSFIILSKDAWYLHRVYSDFLIGSLGSSYTFYRHVIKGRVIYDLPKITNLSTDDPCTRWDGGRERWGRPGVGGCWSVGGFRSTNLLCS